MKTTSWKLILIVSLIHAAACTESDSDPELGTWTESGDQVLPPDDADPTPWCGLESEVVRTDVLALPTDWTDGQPFEVGDFVGYADVSRQQGWILLDMPIFSKDGGPYRTYSLSSILLADPVASAYYHVHDVFVEGPLVHVLFSAVLLAADGRLVDRLLYMATIDPANGLFDEVSLWQIAHDTGRAYQLAVDGNELLLGTYDVYGGKLGLRHLHRAGGFTFLGAEQVIVDQQPADPQYFGWTYGSYLSFEAKDGLLTFQLASNGYDAVQTTRYRACE